MATLLAIISALPQLLKLIGFFIDSIKKTPDEVRRDSLQQFDSAIVKARAGDTTDLSKWLGSKI